MGWQDKAACVGKHYLFEVVDRESRFRRDVKDVHARDTSIKSHNESNFKAAFAICDTCPVTRECLSSATPEDRVYTVRAGRYPSIYRSAQRGRPRKFGVEELATKECANGHIGFYKKINGRSRCMECRRISEANRRSSNGKPKRPVREFVPGTCKRGHLNKYKLDKRGYKYCYECTLEAERIKYRAKSATMPS